MPAACLLLLIGLPGSGKTSLARRLCADLANIYHVTHVEYDAAVPPEQQQRVQAARAAGGAVGAWRQTRRGVELAVESALRAVIENNGRDQGDCEAVAGWNDHSCQTIDELTSTFSSALKTAAACDKSHVFIIDDNMYLRSMRYRYFQVARRRGAGFCQALLDVPETECAVRNSARPRPVPAAALSSIGDRLEPPAPAHRLWESFSVTLKPDELGTSRLTELIAAAVAVPAAPLTDNALEAAAARRVCSDSQRHQADVTLRRLVAEHAARGGGGGGRPERARAANMARQSLLRRLRAGLVGVDAEPAQVALFAEAVAQMFWLELQAGGTRCVE